ncbi:MAG: 3-hydroxyacyl-CoA dehydrogenase NAD-binding domain-containing protein [bacterium]|nr:3-hydroxyacyl-CoA dehydrogenase NAD-binding domain-containing protein [bacterium]
MASNERTLNDIQKILILGAGTMGLRIGLQAAMSGFQVTIYDVSDDALNKAKDFQLGIFKKLTKAGKAGSTEFDSISQKINWTTDLAEACKDPDLVNESVPEDLDLKKKIWKEIGELCPSDTIFTTNTSYLLSSWMADDTGRPELFCAFHFHDVFYANVVDIMPHEGTHEWIIPLLEDLGKKLNQTPVIIRKESPGYIFNAMLLSIIGTAGHLVTSGVSTFQDVDRSWMGNFKMDMGPFAIIDSIGLDTAWRVTNSFKDENSKRFADYLQTFIDAGHLGTKTGQGFYRYPDPEYKRSGFI